MSTTITRYLGYTIDLCNDELTSEDFEYFNKLEDEHPIYFHLNDDIKTTIIVDGNCGYFARMIYTLTHNEVNGWVDEDDEIKNTELKKVPVPEDVSKYMSEAYKTLFNKDLDVSKIHLQEWHTWF